MKVKVWDAQLNLLGEGNFLGRVDVYVWDGQVAESPADLRIEDATVEWFVPTVVKDNPKIQLDDGRIVYGCQVWWKELK